MMTVLKTLFAATIVLVVSALVFAYSGFYNIAADEPHVAVVDWLFETTRERAIETRLDGVVVPSDFQDEVRVDRGAQAYVAMCQQCHLAPGTPPTPLHRGLNPKPPKLEHATSHGPHYLFWTIKHGIKMTGMPAWGESHSDDELWDIVAFLQIMPELASHEYLQLLQATESHVHDHQGTHEAPEEGSSEQDDPQPDGHDH